MQFAPIAQLDQPTTPDGPGTHIVAFWIPKNGAAPSYIDSPTPHVPLVFDGDTHAGLKDAVRGAQMFARETGTAVGVFRNDATDTWSIGALLERTSLYPDGDTFEFDKHELKHGAFRRSVLGATDPDELLAIVSNDADVRFASK
jgi:hypothetical protein